jgi:hypothetical protein
MAGGLFVLGPCVICGNHFSFNAERVPSLVVQGVRQPVCEPCVPAVNGELERLGRTDRLTILPGSYEMEQL